jgi:hypothetical protein
VSVFVDYTTTLVFRFTVLIGYSPRKPVVAA